MNNEPLSSSRIATVSAGGISGMMRLALAMAATEVLIVDGQNARRPKPKEIATEQHPPTESCPDPMDAETAAIVRAQRERRRANFARLHQRGVTLIEVMVVIAIIGVLAGMLIPAITLIRKSAASKTLHKESTWKIERVVDAPSCDVYVLKDASSGGAWVVIQSGHGVAIDRLPATLPEKRGPE